MTIFEYGADDDRIVLGRIAGDLLPMVDVMDAGENLYDVCDADSAGWEEVYSILFENGFDFRSELHIEPSVDAVLFIWKTLLHPKLDPYRRGVFETVSRMFSCSVVAMWNYATKLTEQELADLGFRKIADSKLIYRDMSMVADYSRNSPNGTDVPLELEFTKDDEQWIKQRWDNSDWHHVDREQYDLGQEPEK
ncbi:MAG: hypothetical protein JSS49_30240 [Planctomycetes bacterium]|nr:hypothetical protein [Planctomycetota bacterium]